MPHLTNWAEVNTVAPSASIAKQTLMGEGAALVRIGIRAGFSAERHSHPFEQFVQVLSGSGWLETAEGKQRFSAGSLFHFPADTWHAAGFDEDTVLVETNLTSPQPTGVRDGSRLMKVGRKLAAVVLELLHDFLVEPHVHGRGIIGVAGVVQLARQGLARG